MRHHLLAALLAAGLALAPPARAAELEPETLPRVYPWETPPEGWGEVTLWESLAAGSGLAGRSRLWAQSLELEYGVTDRLALAVYGDTLRPDAAALRFTGVRLEGRYRLFDRYQRLVDAALYLEARLPRAAEGPQELEARLLLERDLGDFRLDLNPTLEKALSGEGVGEPLAFALSAGAYYRRFWVLQPGLELFWNTGGIGRAPALDEQPLSLSPSLDVRFTERWWLHLGAAFGLTGASDRVLLRAFLVYEFPTVSPADQQLP